MPLGVIRAHWKKLPSLLAEQQMRQAAVAAYPHMERAEARRLWDEWRRQAYPDRAAVRPSPSMLAMIGIGVKVVKAGGDV